LESFLELNIKILFPWLITTLKSLMKTIISM